MHSQQLSTSRNGLTFAEGMAALAACTVLAVLLMPACGCGGRSGARLSKAGTEVRNIVNAVRAYQEDYGELPQIGKPRSASERYLFVGPESAGAEIGNESLFDVLRAIDRGVNSGHKLNPKQAKYFEAGKATDANNPREGFTDGREFVDIPQGRLMDPWGEQYCIVFETDNDGVLNLHPIYTDATSLPHPVVAFSFAKDGVVGSKLYPNHSQVPGTTTDIDVTSWQ